MLNKILVGVSETDTAAQLREAAKTAAKTMDTIAREIARLQEEYERTETVHAAFNAALTVIEPVDADDLGPPVPLK